MGSRRAPHRRRVECTLVVGVTLGAFALACGANSSGLFDDGNSSASCDTVACADDSGDVPARARRDPSPRPPPADLAEGASGATSSGDDTITSAVASNGSTPAPEPPPSSLDCSLTSAQAAARCAAGADAGTAQPVPPDEDPPTSVLTIERARWDADDEVLEIRGDVSSSGVTLTAEFFGRSEPLANERGGFRAEFSGVVDNPGTVRVTASDGATVTAPVEED